MKRIATPLLVGSIATILGLAPAAAQSPSPAAGFAPLTEAVTFAPLGAAGILFTDWAAAKAAHGYADVTSATPIDERMRAMVDLGKLEAPFAGYAIEHLATHADDWGWDTTDLDWEAGFMTD